MITNELTRHLEYYLDLKSPETNMIPVPREILVQSINRIYELKDESDGSDEELNEDSGCYCDSWDRDDISYALETIINEARRALASI